MSLLHQILWEETSDEEEIPQQPRKKKIYLPRINRCAKWDEEAFLGRFRVTKRVARAVALHLAPLLKTRTMKNFAITPLQQVLITLDFYASGSFLRCVGDTAGVHKSSVSRIILKVSKAIARMRPDWIKMPQSRQEIERVASKFYQMAAFPKVIGAIDCTHVQIQSPGGPHAEDYRNRKATFSFNVQAISDADLNILNIVARWPGSSHDSHIFNCSTIKGRLESDEFSGYWLLGDSSYAVKPYLLTPLRNPVTEPEKLYNESQIRSRNVVEIMFGCWKRRFPVLSMKIRTHVNSVQPIIVATAILHNICRKIKDSLSPEHLQIEDSLIYDNQQVDYLVENRNDANNRLILINNYFSRL